ncbi:MAG: riboflavin synthase [Candidatus Bipolaricaulaceae bacterium]
MFTGIVEAVGRVAARGPGGLVVSVPPLAAAAGDSVAVNGVCLTVREIQDGHLAVDLSRETEARTTLADLRAGDAVNVERAVPVGGRLGGHFVLGHVDTVGKVTLLERRADERLLEVAFDARFAQLVAEKAAVAVDGISLTPFSVSAGTFRCAVVPYTWDHTNLRFQRVGGRVNLEFDVLAKYVNQWRQR